MKTVLWSAIFAISAIGFAGCATVDQNSEEAAVKRLVAAEGPLQTNVDPDFEGEAYDQEGEKVICKKTKVTGSRIGQYTVCRTEAEWAISEDHASDKIKEMQESGGAFGSND